MVLFLCFQLGPAGVMLCIGVYYEWKPFLIEWIVDVDCVILGPI